MAKAAAEKKAEPKAPAREILVFRLKDQNHPAGQRIVAHRVITKDYSIVVVTPEQAAEIRSDIYVVEEPRGTEQWLKCFGLPWKEDVRAQYMAEMPVLKTGMKYAGIIPHAGESEISEDDALPALEQGDQDVKAPKKDATREEIVAALEAKGLKPGVDFEKDAKIESLQSLLS